MTEELLLTIEIPLYIRQYIRSNSTRAKFYEKGKKTLPLKYCSDVIFKAQGLREPDGKKYGWLEFPIVRQGRKIKVDFLVELATGKRVVSNEPYVGKQNIKNINGQDIYSGNVARHDRNNMINAIKDQYKLYIQGIKPILRFPLRITIYLFDTIIDDVYSNGQEWDLDNRFFPYGKAFSDIMKKEGKIPNDDRFYITEPPHVVYVPVDDSEDRKMVIKIFKDNRPIILNNYLYQKKHGKNLL